LSNRLNIPPGELGDKLTEMAHRGVVIDLERNGKRYYLLPPVVIGFFEYTFMRRGDDLPLPELARLFDNYMREDDRFANSVFQGSTQIGRSLVREEALPIGDHTEILDWERATHLIESASVVGVTFCACRHKAHLLGKACDRELESCLSLGTTARILAKNGLARLIPTDEAMDVLQVSKEAGLAQTGDNVQRKPTYICNCCGCCCEMIQAIRGLGIRNAIVSSNWTMTLNLENCNGCGKCVDACPIQAIELAGERVGNKRRRWVVHDAELCLGCGVCYPTCQFDAIAMKPREQRVFTPETYFDRIVAMAIERGKLAHLIFDAPDKLTHRAMGRILSILEKSPPFKAALAVKPLKSVFMNGIVKSIRSTRAQ
jgi:Na+-translocating ferredoxin:NAD+ oxidoreductase RNF subunit RnfB